MPPLRIALAQLNVTVGDLEGNYRLIAQAIRQAQAWLADIVVVPELAITGYPPEDLLLKPSFVEANRHILQRLARLTRGIIAIVGCVDRNRSGKLYNAAAVLANGRHAATYYKQCLPNYGVFDEKRYFTPGHQSLLLDVAGVRIGLGICEDLWEPWPTQNIAQAGGQLVINISASPYHTGKLKQRAQLFAHRARESRLPIVHCNLVGGQDELVFDGAGLVLDERGRLLAQGRQFVDDFICLDLLAGKRGPASHGTARVVKIPHATQDRPPLPRRPITPLAELEEVYDALTLGVRDYVRKNGFSTVVLGLSGGIDSALTACIAADALGPTHVMGLVMPSRFSSPATQADAKRLARTLGIEVQEISIEPVFRAYLETLKPFFGEGHLEVAEQNIQARIRGNFLMALSNKFGWLVLTTGNKSELATGYTTLYGDMAGGIAVIKDVPKTLVYRLARFRNRHGPGTPIPPSMLTRPPTAELAPNQTDQDTLPPYPVLDRILKAYVEQDRSPHDIVRRTHEEPAIVKRVVRMVDHAEYKRRQGPPGIKITPKAFGRDRRMPITNRYQQN